MPLFRIYVQLGNVRDGLVVPGNERNIVDPGSHSSQAYVSASPFGSVAAAVSVKGVRDGIVAAAPAFVITGGELPVVVDCPQAE